MHSVTYVASNNHCMTNGMRSKSALTLLRLNTFFFSYFFCAYMYIVYI